MSDKLKVYLAPLVLVVLLFAMRYYFSMFALYLFPQVDYSKPGYPYSFSQPFYNRNEPIPTSLTSLWLKWDSLQYLDIVKNGYKEMPFDASSMQNWAFYPLFPLLVNMVSRWFGLIDSEIATFTVGILISNLSFYLSLIFLPKLLDIFHFDKDKKMTVTLLLLAFPASYFFQLFYTESIFLLTTILAFIFLFRRKYFIASIFLSIAVSTRAFGLTLIPAFCLYYFFKEWRSHPVKTILMTPIYGAITAFPVFVFFYRLWELTGNFFAAIDIQKAWNYDTFLPFGYFLRYVKTYGYTIQYGLILGVILLIALIIGVFGCIYIFVKNHTKTSHKLEITALVIYALSYLFLLSSTNNLGSTFRYTVSNIAFFILPVVAFKIDYRKPWVLGVLFLFVTLQTIFFTLFLTLVPAYGF